MVRSLPCSGYMDFQKQPDVLNIKDQYMFGPAFWVCPVTEFEARQREVVLPQTEGGWYDFWTGEPALGGQSINAEALLDSMPLFVRADSIIPFGPKLQYTSEKPANPITLYIFTGADGEFTLYEDDGLTYGYESGEYSTIEVSWSEGDSTLTIGERAGAFPGMLESRTFDIVLASRDTPIIFSFEPTPVRTVQYDGTETVIPF